ncbi:uncharacterized protein ACLA_001830 [Aspergillus clavatus NRRL 1]|uniref:Uncharacterized protein n=1 Tax=Aspergillus clavatus (strain ATCC 1007 / CBS 513.65 / DSM 816 / NCTC 3887 / NRRL 1 / QM 1276 / 107) TaxID=344612 RepID=A1C504_ASPCL|nr:uncharacterized protein ACLA_001830 [Aspergillus clavatus NRRL 1]EAW14772.1 conserved hypothetical protein [Aspergillus clavatus NRRL 1]
MAGEEGDPNQNKNLAASTDSFHEHNPFVAFRRYADEQISSMLQAVMGLPSSVSPPHSGHWAIFAEERGYKEPNYRQIQNEDGTDGGYPSGSENGASGDTENQNPEGKSSRSRWPRSDNTWPSNQRRRANEPSDFFGFDSFFDSFFDRFWFDDHFSSRFFHPFNRPFFTNMMNDDHATWPLAYLIFSPYSPLHLERQASYRAHRDRGVFSSLVSSLNPSSERDPAEPHWREAFEDLLRLENGKPMLDREPTTAVTKKESGTEWLRGLVQRGSLGDRWKYVSGSDGQGWSGITLDSTEHAQKNQHELEERRAEPQAKGETSWKDSASGTQPPTELEMYDRFLRDIEAREREFYKGVYESPLLRSLLEERRRLKNDIDLFENQNRGDDTDSWIDLVSGGNKSSVTEIKSQSSPNSSTTAETSSTTSTTEPQPYVISTRTTTERVRLSDGSIQTKTVKTKRFADGREETNESVEVVNSPQNSHDFSAGQESLENNHPKRNGWFWRD